MKLMALSLLGLVVVSAGLLLGCGNKDEPGDPAGAGGSGEGGSGGSDNDACDGRGDPYVAGITKGNEDKTLIVKILDAVPAPPAGLTDNAWQVEVTDGDGKPLKNAALSVGMLMVDHAHGSPKAVEIDEQGAGVYSLAPFFFSMAGYWEIKINVTPEGSPSEDTMTALFGFCIGS